MYHDACSIFLCSIYLQIFHFNYLSAPGPESNRRFIFCVFLQVIPTIPWYTERVITNITLGGLLVLVVLRTIQYNMTKMRVSTHIEFRFENCAKTQYVSMEVSKDKLFYVKT